MKIWRYVLITLLVFADGIPLSAQMAMPGQEGFLDSMFVLNDSKTARISSYERNGANHDWIVIAPGETKTLAEIPGAGVIRRFYMSPMALDRMRFRKLVLRMYWDGAKDPCVEVPIGDFFGSGLGTLRYFKSLVVNVNPGYTKWDFDAFVNYFPMPFEKGARITLENDGMVQDLRVWYHIDYEQYPSGKLPSDIGRLHAQWRRDAHPIVREGNPKNTTLGNANVKNDTGKDNFLILDAEGQGNYVGLFLTVDNTAGGWYGEGDDMIFVDGAKWPPTYPGTGHEEIFNSGCCPDEEFWGPYTGFYLIENYKADFGGKNQMYRFYINDPVRFQKSIRVTIEHGHANNFDNGYTSTAFWYQKDPHKAFPPMPKAQDRLPSWPDEVAQAIDKEAKLLQEAPLPPAGGRLRMSAEDQKLATELGEARTKEFRKLDFDSYIRDVDAYEDLVKHYRKAKPQ